MKMPAKMKAKWLKALRSGEYKQATGTLYNPQTCGFCCLGVLQHTVSKGSVEAYDEDGVYREEPSDNWYDSNGIEVVECDPDITKLVQMNDGKYSVVTTKNGSYQEKRTGKRKFSTIADWIEKNIETY